MPDASSPPTDADLEALRNRDPEAVRRWIYGNRDYIQSVLQRYAGDPELARDLVQETFFQALRSLPNFRGNSKVTTWLHSIAKNVALSRHHEDQRHRYLEEETLEHVQATSAANTSDATFSPGPLANSPEEAAERGQEHALLYEAMEELSDSYREIIRLRDLEERSTKEVAECLDLTRVNVRVRLHRARATLQGALDNRLEETEQMAA